MPRDKEKDVEAPKVGQVKARLSADSPVGGLDVGGRMITRDEAQEIPQAEFERLAAEYGLEIVPEVVE